MKCIISILFFACVTLVFVNYANAYIDPGTGSMVIQAILGTIAVCAVSIGIFWRRLKGFLGRLVGRNKE